MSARAYWKGYLKLSLVSCPITLSFHRINKETGNRLRQQLVDEETGETLQRERVGRGYEVGRHRYVEVEDEELDKIKIESTHTIDIEQFVPRSEIAT
jgi:DNA end-binding protein Ku